MSTILSVPSQEMRNSSYSVKADRGLLDHIQIELFLETKLVKTVFTYQTRTAVALVFALKGSGHPEDTLEDWVELGEVSRSLGD